MTTTNPRPIYYIDVPAPGTRAGIITKSYLLGINELAVEAHKAADSIVSDDPAVKALVAAVQALADGLNQLQAEVYQIAVGVENQQIAVQRDNG